jgi:hypothetical protein
MIAGPFAEDLFCKPHILWNLIEVQFTKFVLFNLSMQLLLFRLTPIIIGHRITTAKMLIFVAREL